MAIKIPIIIIAAINVRNKSTATRTRFKRNNNFTLVPLCPEVEGRESVDEKGGVGSSLKRSTKIVP